MVINEELARNQEEHGRATKRAKRNVRYSDHHEEISPTLGMSFDLIDNTSTTEIQIATADNMETTIIIPPPPRADSFTIKAIKVQYEVTREEDAGRLNPDEEDDVWIESETRMFNKRDLTTEVWVDI